MAKEVDRKTYQQIVTRLKRGDSRRQVGEDLKLGDHVVGKIAVHAGIAKPNAKVKAADTATVERWLATAKAKPKKQTARKK